MTDGVFSREVCRKLGSFKDKYKKRIGVICSLGLLEKMSFMNRILILMKCMNSKGENSRVIYLKLSSLSCLYITVCTLYSCLYMFNHFTSLASPKP